MARPQPSAPCSAGALLVLASWLAFPASVLADGEGAGSAAPTSCVVAQFALRAYVTARASGDSISPARDPARIAAAITPVCRQAIENGRWPGLAAEMLAHVAEDVAMKPAICQIAPPEAWSAIAAWEAAGDETRYAYDVPCAVALFRHVPDDFARLVTPRLAGGDPCAFGDLAARLGEAIDPDERLRLLPALEQATRAHAEGRDRLYDILCQGPTARRQPVCQAPARLEPSWARQARIKRARPGMAQGVLALLFAVVACLLRYFLGKEWPAVGMSVLATAATAGVIAWVVVSASTPGAGAVNVLNVAFAMVVAPVAALVGGLVARAFIRAVPQVGLPWCLFHALVYGVVTSVHAWSAAWDRLC